MKVINPLKGKTDKSWFFEQDVYSSEGLVRAIKAGGGTGNLPKVIELVGDRDNPSFSVKDIAFTIPSNPMSDRQQLVLEYESATAFGFGKTEKRQEQEILPEG